MAVFLWIGITSLLILSHSQFPIQKVFSKLRFAAFPWIAPFCYLMILELFEQGHKKTKFWVKISCYLIPAWVTLGTLFFDHTHYFSSQYEQFSWGGLNTLRRTDGPFFKLHYYNACFLIAVCTIFLLKKILSKTSNPMERGRALPVLLGMLTTLLIDMWCVLGHQSLRWLMLPTGAQIFYELGIFFSVFRYGLLGLLPEHANTQIQKQFFALVSHDLLSHFRAMSFLSQHLKQNQSERNEDLEKLHQSFNGALEFLKNLITWSKRQSIQQQPTFKVFELKTLTQEVLEQLELSSTILSTHSIQVIADPEPLLVLGDSELIASVLRNLINNAIQHSSLASNSPVEIKIILKKVIRNQEEKVEVIVQDQGEGMSPTLIQKILSRSPTRSPQSLGYGMGLALVQDFLDLHQSSLKIESQLGQGTQISFDLTCLPKEQR